MPSAALNAPGAIPLPKTESMASFGSADDAMNCWSKSDSDDDMGFSMYTNLEMMGASQPTASSSKPLKVVNLIDFHACDMREENEEQPPFPDIPGTFSGASGVRQPWTIPIPFRHQQQSFPAECGVEAAAGEECSPDSVQYKVDGVWQRLPNFEPMVQRLLRLLDERLTKQEHGLAQLVEQRVSADELKACVQRCDLMQQVVGALDERLTKQEHGLAQLVGQRVSAEELRSCLQRCDLMQQAVAALLHAHSANMTALGGVLMLQHNSLPLSQSRHNVEDCHRQLSIIHRQHGNLCRDPVSQRSDGFLKIGKTRGGMERVAATANPCCSQLQTHQELIGNKAQLNSRGHYKPASS